MAEQPMETTFHTMLWQQFGAAIDMLENAVVACPDSLWEGHLWSDSTDHPLPEGYPPEFDQFWYITYHALFWLDLYLSGVREEDFFPAAPFTRAELDPEAAPPKQPYTKEKLRGYLATTRRKCHDTLVGLTDERASQGVPYPWLGDLTFLELQLYNMRHMQEHAAQLSLFLGQHGIPGEAVDWVPRAQVEFESF